MALKTPLFDEHQRLGARIVSFGGWDMPLHYGSQLEEHHAVRRAVGLFDVSHMRPVDVSGAESRSFLRHLLANDVAKLQEPGKALYSCLLNEAGGVIDDLIVYWRDGDAYRIVVNAATTDKDLAWMRERADGFAVQIAPRDDLAMLAVQGPDARALAAPCVPPALQEAIAALAPFASVEDGPWLVARTGYTGEDGLEVMLPAGDAPGLWRDLSTAGARPCGLGARDTLRLEAGMNLSGQDMDEQTTPLESGLGWTVAWEPAARDFIGRAALHAQRGASGVRRLIGVVLEGPGILRAHQPVYRDGERVGELTSGGFAPTLERSIGLARVQPGSEGDWEVEIRGRRVPLKVVRPPFVRHGRSRIDE